MCNYRLALLLAASFFLPFFLSLSLSLFLFKKNHKIT